MAKVKLNLRNLSPAEKIAKARQIAAALTGNPDFPNPQPPLASLTAAADELETALADVQTARQLVMTNTSIAHGKEDTIDGRLRQSAAFVESIAGDDETKILSAGINIKSTTPTTHASVAPIALGVTAGDRDGELNLAWDPVKGAKSYVIERSIDPPTAASWTHEAVSSKSSATVSGLVSGTRYWFRVAAVTSAGQSGWSDPATKIAP